MTSDAESGTSDLDVPCINEKCPWAWQQPGCPGTDDCPHMKEFFTHFSIEAEIGENVGQVGWKEKKPKA